MLKEKSRKASLDIAMLLSVVVAALIAAGVYTVFSWESGLNSKTIKDLDHAMIINAYANLVATDSCLIANDSIKNKRYYRLDIDFVRGLTQNAEIPCINFPNFEYILKIYVKSNDLSRTEEEYVFKNVDNVEEFENPIEFYVVTTDGKPGILAFTYLNITEG